MIANLEQTRLPAERKKSKVNYRVFQHAHIQGIPEAIETKQTHQRVIWLVAIIATNIACGIHLFFLLSSFVNEPNETKMTYEPKAALLPPTIIVCQPATRFLNPESVSNISAEYYYALELGVGLIHMAQLDRLQYSLNISKVEEYHQQILSENNGSAAVAYHNFHHKHMRKCEDTFIHCYTELFDKADCCKIFKQVFTLYGMCYAARNKSVVITGSDSLANFRFRLNFTQSTRPHFFHRKPKNILSSFNKEAYEVGFSDGLDQGNFLVERQLVLPNQWLTVNMRQQQSTLLSNPERCIPNREKYEKLNYFLEYTRSNCRWERTLLNNLTLLNKTCELPLVQLLNKNRISSSPCNLSQIFNLFGYKRNGPIIYSADDIKAMEDDLNTDFRQYISEYCDLYRNRTSLPKCTAEKLLSIGLPEEANNYLYHFNNTRPYSLEQKFGENLKRAPDSIRECLPLCNSTCHLLTASSVNNGEGLEENTASVVLQYTTMDVETVAEDERQTASEYLAMIGGNIGMWNGASLLALCHLAALGVGALGFLPFHAQEVQ